MESLKGQNLYKYSSDKMSQSVFADQILEDNSIICIYFSAHWCPPCRGFTPILKNFYDVSKF